MVVDALVVGALVVEVVDVGVDEIIYVVVAAATSASFPQCPQDFLQTFGICVFVLSQ